MSTFFIRFERGLWEVDEERHETGGLFATLAAALAFARQEAARATRARLVIVGA